MQEYVCLCVYDTYVEICKHMPACVWMLCHMCVGVFMQMCAYMYECVCVNQKLISSVFINCSTLVFEAGTLAELGAQSLG